MFSKLYKFSKFVMYLNSCSMDLGRDISPEVWSQFQCHSHHAPLPFKHPLTINNIGPPIALTLKAVIIPPLILGYKYEKLRREKGLVKNEL